MRKSERIRLLELELVRLSLDMEYLKSMMSILLESVGLESKADLDAGKWYNRKPTRND